MKLVPVSVVFLVAMSLGVGLEPWWRVGSVAPEPLLVLMAFLALLGPAPAAVMVALAAGVATDSLHSPFEGPAIIGPRAVGYTLGAWAIVQARGSLFRGSVVTLVAMVLLGGFLAELVAIALVTLRGAGPLPGGPPRGWVAGAQLWAGMGRLLLTAAAALPLGALLFALRGWLGVGRGGK